MKMAAESAVTTNESAVRKGIRELLGSLSEEVLTAFLKSATSSLIRYGNVPLDDNGQPRMGAKDHAIESILSYSDTIGLLNRQRMKKDYLAQYLDHKGVKMTMPATKTSLCRDVLNYWGHEVPDNLRLVDHELIRNTRKTRSNQQGPIPAIKSEDRKPGTSHAHSSHNMSNQVNVENGSQGQVLVPVSVGEPQMDVSMEYDDAISLRRQEIELGQQLAKQFAVWFFERLNTLTDFTSAHFWPECNLRLEFIFAAQAEKTFIDEVLNNGEICCANLKDLVVVKQLRFNPHTETGIRGYLNPHGLAQVVVCGVLHHAETMNPVGVFEQMFGLMKDPTKGNNFRIKFSVLRLREGSHLALQASAPELCDSSLVGIIEEIEDDYDD